MKKNIKYILLCLLPGVLLLMFMLRGCFVQQPLDETVPTGTTTQTAPRETTGALEEGELPPVTVSQQTQPTTEPTRITEPADETTQPVTPPATTVPPKPTQPPATTAPPATETTAPPETTQPTETTAPTETQPAETTAPTETQPAETTAPTETTVPTEPSEQPGFDEDELPPVPVG